MKRKCEEKETPLRMKSRVKAMADTEDGSGRELIEFEWDMELPRCFPTLVEHISSVLIPDLARMVAEYATQPVCEAFGESIRLESDEHDYLHNSGYFRPIYEFATLLGIKRGEEDDCGNGPCNCLPRSIVFDILDAKGWSQGPVETRADKDGQFWFWNKEWFGMMDGDNLRMVSRSQSMKDDHVKRRTGVLHCQLRDSGFFKNFPERNAVLPATRFTALGAGFGLVAEETGLQTKFYDTVGDTALIGLLGSYQRYEGVFGILNNLHGYYGTHSMFLHRDPYCAKRACWFDTEDEAKQAKQANPRLRIWDIRGWTDTPEFVDVALPYDLLTTRMVIMGYIDGEDGAVKKVETITSLMRMQRTSPTPERGLEIARLVKQEEDN